MRIDADGDVGIGTTPVTHARLTLGGTTASYSASLVFDNNTTGGAEFFMLASDSTWTAGSNKFIMGHGTPGSGNVDVTIDSAGRVGIGTYNPGNFNSQGNNLVVGTGSGDQGITIFSGSGSGDSGNLFFADGTGDPDWVRAGITYDHGTNQMKFRVNDVNRIEIDSSGNVGIGTSNPQNLLHLESNSSGETRIRFKSDNLGGSHGLFWVDENAVNQSQFYYNHSSNKQFLELNGNGLQIYSKQTSSAIAEFGSGAGGYNKFSIPNGRIGIGVTPSAALDIAAYTNIDGITLRSSQAYNTHLNYQNTGSHYISQSNSGSTIFRNQNSTLWSINSSGHFLPGVDNSFDIGSTSQTVRNIYTGDLHLSNEGHEEGNTVDGTKGNWTIQEGEEHLYIINNKSGKKYKFALEEIE